MHIPGYLTESVLHQILTAFCESRGYPNPTAQVRLPGTRMSYDFEIVQNGKTVYVEFDGDQHYRDANVMYRDRLKDSSAAANGKGMVRIPYFVQLSRETFLHYFGEEFDISTSFPHGFHTTKMLPASFCPLGISRYTSELSGLPPAVTESIEESLRAKAKLLPPEFVFPA